MLIFALFGLAYGFVLQRSGFCFARAAYELFLLRTRDAVNGVMAGLLVATVGFGAVVLIGMHVGLWEGGRLLLLPAGVGTMLGGALFGAGMTLAGMCAAGTLVRIGEGYVVAWATLLGIIGAAFIDPSRLLGPGHVLSSGANLSLTQFVGPGPGFLITIAALAVLWIGLMRAARPSHGATASRSWRSMARSFLMPPLLGGVLLGLLNTAQMATLMPWTVGYPLTLVPALLSGGPSGASVRAALPLLALDGCIVLGAVLAGATSGDLHLRWPRRPLQALHGLGGGLLMGWGIQTAHACNIGGVFSAIPSLSLSGWLYLAAIIFGAWLGMKIVSRTV